MTVKYCKVLCRCADVNFVMRNIQCADVPTSVPMCRCADLPTFPHRHYPILYYNIIEGSWL